MKRNGEEILSGDHLLSQLLLKNQHKHGRSKQVASPWQLSSLLPRFTTEMPNLWSCSCMSACHQDIESASTRIEEIPLQQQVLQCL